MAKAQILTIVQWCRKRNLTRDVPLDIDLIQTQLSWELLLQ